MATFDDILRARFGPTANVMDYIGDTRSTGAVSRAGRALRVETIQNKIDAQFPGENMTYEELIRQLKEFDNPANLNRKKMAYKIPTDEFLVLCETMYKAVDLLPELIGDRLYRFLIKVFLYTIAVDLEDDDDDEDEDEDEDGEKVETVSLDYDEAKRMYLRPVFHRYGHMHNAVTFWSYMNSYEHMSFGLAALVLDNIPKFFPPSFLADRSHVTSEMQLFEDKTQLREFGDLWFFAGLPLYNPDTGDTLPELTGFPNELSGWHESNETRAATDQEILGMVEMMANRDFGNVRLPTWDDVGGDGNSSGTHPFVTLACKTVPTFVEVIVGYVDTRDILIPWSPVWTKVLAAALVCSKSNWLIEYFIRLEDNPESSAPRNWVRRTLAEHVLPIANQLDASLVTRWENLLLGLGRD